MIRAGLVAFGMAGRVFHAPLLSSVDGVELAAVVERNSNNAAERYPDIITYRSLDELLSDASIDLVVVATPTGSHFEVARQVLQAGKHVVVDKPVAVTSAEIATLIKMASAQNALLVPFHSRLWDSDYRTLVKLMQEDSLGRLVHFESTLDRWRPAPTARRPWKEDPAQGGGVLLDLGTHIAYQALELFGKPESVGGEVLRERDGVGSNDSFTIRMHYPGFSVTLGSNCLSALARPRFHLRGIKGNYWKWGVDPQEAALNKVTHISDPRWGEEPSADWGTLCVDVDGGTVTRPVPSIPGDYRLFYAGVRDALLGKAPTPVPAACAWRAARVLEWATQSSQEHRDIVCDWENEPL
jgi:predicted dehydrogenase